MAFIEIAYQAEVSRVENSEFDELAQRNCNECPETRQKTIEEFREMIYERGECNPRRMDDAFLLRFLRCRKYILPLAHKLMVRYHNFRCNHAGLYHCHAFNLDKVRHIYATVLPDNPTNGRVVLMRFGRWDPDSVTAMNVVQSALLMDEVFALQPKLQVLGITIVVDLEGLSLRHVRRLTPTIASQIVDLMGVSFPLIFHGIHMVKYSWLLNTFFYVFKQFIPAAAWERIHFHGYDMQSLHKHIDPEHLPEEYDGTCQYVATTEEWVSKINRYKDDFLVRELRSLGFKVEQ